MIFDIETVVDPAMHTGPDFAPVACWRVVAIGCMTADRFGVVQGETERDIVAAFWSYVARERPRLISWNGRGFDLPVLTMRALHYGIALPPGWFSAARSRYRDDVHLDVMDWLAEFGAARPTKLDHAAKLVGFPGKRGTDGADVSAMSRAEVERYVLCDVAQTAGVSLRAQLLRGSLTRAQYLDAARVLVRRIEEHAATKAVAEHMDRNVFFLGEAA